jgi:hypothetical protein
MSQPISLVKLAHGVVKDKVKPGAFVIDATLGNGNDARFLAGLVSPHGRVFGFDIQQKAVENTRILLQTNGLLDWVTLIHDDHAKMRRYLPDFCLGKISVVMFNLGYLPGSDKLVITRPETTLTAISCSIEYLAADGIISILAYPGHAGGENETGQVVEWCHKLNPVRYRFSEVGSEPFKPSSPRLFIIEKITE